MTGQTLKEFIQRGGYKLSEIASIIGESPQNFGAALSSKDIKSGLLERVAKAVGKPVSAFYGEAAAKEPSTEERLLALLEEKDKQINKLLSILEQR